MTRTWILGAADPEMAEIEALLRECGETVVYARGPDGNRVRPGNAYTARLDAHVASDAVYEVECMIEDRSSMYSLHAITIDHHRPGDPGYGRPPSEFFPASSLGQVISELARLDGSRTAEVPQDLVLAAAADHCLGAAYRGECPGVDPDDLMRWRAKSRAEFQGRSVSEVLCDVARASAALASAHQMVLDADIRCADMRGYGLYREVTTLVAAFAPDASVDAAGVGDSEQLFVGSPETVEGCWDEGSHHRHLARVSACVPELPEAATRLGVPYVSGPLETPDGRKKYTCSGNPEVVRAFLDTWGPDHGLVGMYGDPARGFAGGYFPVE